MVRVHHRTRKKHTPYLYIHSFCKDIFYLGIHTCSEVLSCMCVNSEVKHNVSIHIYTIYVYICLYVSTYITYINTSHVYIQLHSSQTKAKSHKTQAFVVFGRLKNTKNQICADHISLAYTNGIDGKRKKTVTEKQGHVQDKPPVKINANN